MNLSKADNASRGSRLALLIAPSLSVGEKRVFSGSFRHEMTLFPRNIYKGHKESIRPAC
jgi:hypothetical protein